MVRLVRLTRPEVIVTWLPDYVVGENHEDHQAAGVLATEAFDLAANPVAFPEQLEAPRNRWSISNYGEGLRPWQPKKIYYVSDASHYDFYKGNGPEYPPSDVSPFRKMPYSRIAAEAWSFYKTQQNDFSDALLKQFTEMPVRFIFGKSLVGGSTTGDVLEGITPVPIAYVRARGYEPGPPGVTVELGGPWAFYREFWSAHNIEYLKNLFTPEAQVAPGDTLWIPVLIRNNTDATKQVTLRTMLPAGWSKQPDATLYTVAAHDSYAVQFWINPSPAHKDTWQTLTWEAESDGQKLPPVTLRVDVAGNGLPQ
jgi:hypothetical protein